MVSIAAFQAVDQGSNPILVDLFYQYVPCFFTVEVFAVRKVPSRIWDWKDRQPPWRNRLARSAVNRKVGGSSPPGGAFFSLAKK